MSLFILCAIVSFYAKGGALLLSSRPFSLVELRYSVFSHKHLW